MERNTMLGELIEAIVGLPTEVIRVLYDLVEKLLGKAGQDWLIELKKFLRKEKCWGRIFLLWVGVEKTTEQVVTSGENDWVNPDVNGQNFPMRPCPFGHINIELKEFDFGMTTEEILAEADERGLEIPLYEHALLFWEQFPYEIQREVRGVKKPIVFLHEPWTDHCTGAKVVMVIDRLNKGRKLSLESRNRTWKNYRFAFVNKSVLY